MIVKTEEFVNCCKDVLFAVDSKNVSMYTETLELFAHTDELKMSVTNREYYITKTFQLDELLDNDLKASVNAELFLKLISKITSKTIDLLVEGNTLKIKGNGSYKLPLVFNGDKMLEIPKIEILNETNEMEVKSETLQKILIHNSKELQRGSIVKPIQEYYYLDEKGCVTFTSGACVNNFTLDQPVKLLLSDKVVRLFKLFKDVEDVKLTVGQDPIGDGIIQTKMKFESPTVSLVAIQGGAPGLMSTGPYDAIRTMANNDYAFSAVVHREELLQVLNRLTLFNTDKNCCRLTFTNGNVTVKDYSSDNIETINTHNDCPTLTSYDAIVNMKGLSSMLGDCADEYITICFGDSKALTIKKHEIVDILPELHEA